MGPVKATKKIDAPREAVFEVLCDLANRPAFTDHFLDEFRLERLESSGVGAAARMRVNGRMWMETVIEEASAPHRIRERGKGGRLDRIPILTYWELIEELPGSCEVAVSFWTDPSHPLDRLRELRGAERSYRRSWSHALSRLKEIVESGRPPERIVVAGAARVPATGP
ncbi:MAG TPA: SRPBCC family protein [Solirubrobacterales bacterium]|nr:SRPBCC family protein [Solirubrobacterales bacterium]